MTVQELKQAVAAIPESYNDCVLTTPNLGYDWRDTISGSYLLVESITFEPNYDDEYLMSLDLSD